MKSIFCVVAMLVWGIFASVAKAAEAGKQIIEPIFNSNGKKICYTVVTFDEKSADAYAIKTAELWSIYSDGSNARRLTQGKIDGTARWSLDGKRLAFVRSGNVWVVNADGTGLRQITKTKNADETSPEFSNDGKILYFVRSEDYNATEFIKGAKPMYLPGMGVVIAFNLTTGKEQVRLKTDDNIKLVVPNRANANELLLLYDFYDTKAKSVTGKGFGAITSTRLAAVSLDGKSRRILFAIDYSPAAKIIGIDSTALGPLLDIEKTDTNYKTSREIFLLLPAGKKMLDDFPGILNDISDDGKTLIGLGASRQKVGDDWKFEFTIKTYDIATEAVKSVPKQLLLGSPVQPPITKTAPVATATPVPTRGTPTASKPVPAKSTIEPSAEAKSHLTKGVGYAMTSAYGQAIDEYSKAIELYPQYADAFLNRGLSYARMSEIAQAVADFDTVIRLRPQDVEGYLQRAEMFFIQADNVAALADYNQAIKLAPRNARVWRSRATFFSAIGKNQEAFDDEKKAKALEAAN